MSGETDLTVRLRLLWRKGVASDDGGQQIDEPSARGKALGEERGGADECVERE